MVGTGGNAGVCIGRKVMLVVFRCVDIRRWAALSMEAAVMVVDVVCELLVCLVLRQLSLRIEDETSASDASFVDVLSK